MRAASRLPVTVLGVKLPDPEMVTMLTFDEVGIHLLGTMDPSDCASTSPGSGVVHERHEVGVRVLGLPRTAAIDLMLPFAVRRGEGADDTGPA